MNNKPLNDAKLALKWACDERTIRRWRKDRAPLQDAKAMRSWLSTRKHIPLGTAALLEGIRTTDVAAGHAVEDSKLPTGATFALNRLAAAEAAAYAAFCRATESGDLVSIKARRETWLKISENLRRFDLAIEEARRDSGQLLPKAAIEHPLRQLGICLYAASNEMIPTVARELAGELDLVRARAIIRKCCYQTAILSYAYLESQDCPRWMVDCLDNSLVSTVNITREEISKIAEFMKAAMGAVVPKIIEGEPHVEPEPHYELPTKPEATNTPRI
jgi:hypothetical protein